MTKTTLIYHTDYKGYEVPHTKKELHNACKVFDELIVLSADIRVPRPENYFCDKTFSFLDTFSRTKKILNKLKPETKVILGTHLLTEKISYIPDISAYSSEYPKLDFTGTYFNEESFFHSRFRNIWSSLNKIEGRKVWIPYTGAWHNELYTLSQILLLKKKFDTVFVQPNYYQKRYGKQPWQMKNLARFIKNHKFGVEFEIDKTALDYDKLISINHPYMRAMRYFLLFSDIKNKAFYTGGLDIGKYSKCYQEMVEKC